VILDSDLAMLYGVPTKRLNEQYRRNRTGFPKDFAFQLTAQEAGCLRSQIAASSSHGGRRHRAYAFTEHGALMAANILNGARAVQMKTTCGDAVGWTALFCLGNGRAIWRARVNIFVVREFAKMREALRGARELARKLAKVEKKLTARSDVHEAAIVEILREVMQILNPPPEPEPPRRRIGFHEP